MATIPILTTVLMIPWPALGQLFTHEKGDARWRTHTAICGHVPEDQDEIRYEAVGYIRIPMATENDVDDYVLRKDEAVDIWFWHFPALNNSDTAPLAVFLGGDQPATSSADRVFGPTGPCSLNEPSRNAVKEEYADVGPSANWLSYNLKVNTLYIDTPAPVGFSVSKQKTDTVSRVTRETWQFLQRFIAMFPQYEDREMALWGFDFGAQYATNAADFILERNQQIREGKRNATIVNLTSLGLVSPHLDLPVQHRAFIEFAHKNKYRSVISRELYDKAVAEYDTHHALRWSKCALYPERECVAELRAYREQFHNLTIGDPYVPPPDPERKTPIWWKDPEDPKARKEPLVHELPAPARTSFDPWDVRLPQPGDMWGVMWERAPDRSAKTEIFLNREEVRSWLGVEKSGKRYTPFNREVWNKIKDGQEIMRSSVHALRRVELNGARVLIIGGDADMMSSHLAMSEILDHMEGEGEKTWSQMVPMNFKPPMPGPTLSSNETIEERIGEYKARGNVGWLVLDEMGHDLEMQDPELMRLLFYHHVFGQPFDEYLEEQEPPE